MKKVTVSRIAKKQIIHRCPVQADRIPVALQRNGLYTTVLCKQTGFQSHCKETDYTPLSYASRPDSSRIAKKQIIHHCKQTGFQSHCKETDFTPLSCASRPDSSRIAKKQIIHHFLVQADRIPVALQRNRLYTFCKEIGNIHFLSSIYKLRKYIVHQHIPRFFFSFLLLSGRHTIVDRP
jgi:hypothetical protein